VTTAERMTLTAADIDELLPTFLENVACTQEEIDTQMAELEAASE
jgi:hypothetical protein